MENLFNYVDFLPAPYICTAGIRFPHLFKVVLIGKGKVYGVLFQTEMMTNCLVGHMLVQHVLGFCGKRISMKVKSFQKLTHSVLGSSKSGTATGSGDTHAASSLSSGATAQDV